MGLDNAGQQHSRGGIGCQNAATDSGEHSTQRATLADRIRRGAGAVVLIEALHQVLNLVFLSVLYRTLGVEPYGLLAMVVPFLYLARIVVTSGLDVATIQREGLDLRQVSTIFWLQQCLGLAVTVVMAAGAPAVAWFYREPRLTAVTIALAGTNLLATLGMQHFALLQRRLRLAEAAWVRLIAGVSGSVAAIWAALARWHVWALVVQMYVELAVFALLAWLWEPFLPRLALRGSGARGMLRFGGQCAWANLMYFVMSQFDKVAVGYSLGAYAAALYSQAYNLASKPVQLVITRLAAIMLPALSRAQGDPEFFRGLLVTSLRLIAATMFPAGIGLALVATDVMVILGGEAWRPAGILLAVLALTILFQGFVQSFGTVLAAVGAGGLLARVCTAIAAIQCTSVLLGLWIGAWLGLPLFVVAISYTAAFAFVIFPLYLVVVLKVAGVRVSEAVDALWPSAWATILMGLGVGGARAAIVWMDLLGVGGRLLVLVALGICLYLATAWAELRRLSRFFMPSSWYTAGCGILPWK